MGASGQPRTEAGIRGVAMFEAAKGAVVVVAGCGLLALVHHDLQTFAAELVRHTHLNPAKHTARIFLEAAKHLDDRQLTLFAMGALVYATMRFVEAYGLWRGRRWAEWFAVVSGGIYVPMEVYELTRGFGWLKIAALVVNLAIVAYIASVLARKQARTSPPGG